MYTYNHEVNAHVHTHVHRYFTVWQMNTFLIRSYNPSKKIVHPPQL